MGIEIWNGSSWVSSSDPEIYNGSSFVDIQKGELYNGSSWVVFYTRVTVTPVEPDIVLSSATTSSITVYVTLPTGTPYKTQVEVYRTANPLGRTLIPASPAVGAITSSSGTHVETGLAAASTYQFSAVSRYYDATTNELVGTSTTRLENFSTTAYTLTVPTTPTSPSKTDVTITFRSTSSANFSTNASDARIRFHLEQYGGATFGWLEVDVQDSAPFTTNSVTRDETFSGLDPGATYRCRARTYYTTINEFSAYSAYSANVTTFVATTVSTGAISLNNSTYLDTAASSASASSTADGSSPSRASDNSNTTGWLSDPFTGTTTTESRTISSVSRTSTSLTYNFSTKRSISYTEVDADGIATLTSTFIERLRWNDGGTGARYCTLRWGAGENPPFYAGDSVTISGVGDTSVNGNKVIVDRKLSDSKWAIVVSRTSSTTDAAWVSDSGTAAGSVTNGNQVSNLNTVGFKTTSQSNDLSAVIPSSSAGTTPSFTLANTSGTITLRGKTAKGAGTETITVNFAPKSTLSDPRMRGGVDYVQLTNDTLGSQTFTIEMFLADGTWDTIGTYTLASGATQKYYGFSGTRYPSNLFGTNYFIYRITTDRVDAGLAGWVVGWKEIKIQFAYDELT